MRSVVCGVGAGLVTAMFLTVCAVWAITPAQSTMEPSQTNVPSIGARSGPLPPSIVGWTVAADGTPLNGCTVTVTEERTGEVVVWNESRQEWDPNQNIYAIQMLEFMDGWAYYDVLNVTATKGALIGWNEAQITDTNTGYIEIDVTLNADVFTMNLVTGRNMVSLPLVGYGYKASTLGLNSGDTVSEWNSLTKTYKNYIVGLPVNDFAIVPGNGYEINVPSGTRTLTIYGITPTATQSKTITVPAVGGWATVGFVGKTTTRHASDIPAMYNIPGSITIVATWNPVTKKFTDWLSVIPRINNFALAPGQAYWINARTSGMLSYETEVHTMASFTYTVDGLKVNVDASPSRSDSGIVSYEWNWGDGTVPDVMTSPIRSHTYGVSQGTVPAPPPGGAPYPPYPIYCYAHDSNGNPLSGCNVTFTNKRTGEFLTAWWEDQGYYGVDIGYLGGWRWDDKIEVTAVNGNMFGSNWGILDYGLMLDVTLRTPGPQLITLSVKDKLDQTDATSHRVIVPHQLVVALFTYSVSNSTVHVDASDSTADAGIASYAWDWGDGSALEVLATPIASHTYGMALATSSTSTVSGSGYRIPVEPDLVFGYTYYGDGTILTGCHVTVTNTRSGEVATAVSDEYGYYQISFYADQAGDVIKVIAVKDVFSGANSGVLEYAGLWHLWLNVSLTGPLITLTVTDALGHANSTSTDVMLDGQPRASFTISPPSGYQTTIFTFDASASSDDVTQLSELQARWDWEGDGVWDTTWSTNKQTDHQFVQHGTYRVHLEVMDTDGLVGFASKDFLVDYWAPGWTGMTLDSPGITGVGSSIAVDSNDNIHISYKDFASENLRYSTNVSGSWTSIGLDNTTHVGLYTSIALDSRNKVHISYLDSWNNNLKYATNAGGSWVYSVLDSVDIVGWYNSIAVDSNDKVHISYYDMSHYDLKYATNAGGSWACYTLDSMGDVGEGTAIAVDSKNHVHISYYDHTNGDLKYATNVGGSWAYYTLDCIGSVGEFNSIAVDSKDKIHISYQDWTNNDLKYATNKGGSWVCYTLDSAMYVGSDNSIAVDSRDNVHISYFDAVNTSLKYATNKGGSWACYTLDSLGRAGDFGTSIATDSSNKVHISYYSDASWGLKYIYEA